MQAKYDEIIGITDAFCTEHLSEGYANLCRTLTAALARKRPSPLQSGKALSWAGGILYALGKVNHFFYKWQTPHIKANKLCELLGVSDQHTASKAREILEMVKSGRIKFPQSAEDPW
jgi:Domain of unknown function (DUF6398)